MSWNWPLCPDVVIYVAVQFMHILVSNGKDPVSRIRCYEIRIETRQGIKFSAHVPEIERTPEISVNA